MIFEQINFQFISKLNTSGFRKAIQRFQISFKSPQFSGLDVVDIFQSGKTFDICWFEIFAFYEIVLHSQTSTKWFCNICPGNNCLTLYSSWLNRTVPHSVFVLPSLFRFGWTMSNSRSLQTKFCSRPSPLKWIHKTIF